MEQQEGSPVQAPLREDELAKVLANMGECGQSSSPSNLHAEEEPKEHSAHEGNAPEESHAKDVEEESQPVHDENMRGDAEQEQSVPSQMTREETTEAGGEKEVTQEITEPTRVLSSEQPGRATKKHPKEKIRKLI